MRTEHTQDRRDDSAAVINLSSDIFFFNCDQGAKLISFQANQGLQAAIRTLRIIFKYANARSVQYRHL